MACVDILCQGMLVKSHTHPYASCDMHDIFMLVAKDLG